MTALVLLDDNVTAVICTKQIVSVYYLCFDAIHVLTALSLNHLRSSVEHME